MKWVPLNVFQRLVRQWDRTHPYNAAQMLRIAGRADAAAMTAAWQGTIAAMGLGPVRVRRGRFAYESINGSTTRHAIAELPPGTDLAAYITSELNRPFTDEQDLPLRPFLLQEADSYVMGVVYQHWIADSASIRMLLRAWFVRLHDPARARTAPAIIPRGGYWRYFGPEKSRWGVGGQILMLLQSSRRLRRVRRLHTPKHAGYAMRFTLHRLPAGVLERAHQVARRHGVTLNDLFVACIADVCDRFLPLQSARRRQNLAVGTIVDLRSRSREKMDDLFGLFLGFASVICQRRDMGNRPALMASISEQTRQHKATDVPQASSLWIAAALAAGVVLPRAKRLPFYRKHLPLAAGISNVNLNHTWAAAYHPAPLLEYLRVSPTGPMVPLVFTPTTLGTEFHFGLTYRTAVISDEQAGEMAERFRELLMGIV